MCLLLFCQSFQGNKLADLILPGPLQKAHSSGSIEAPGDPRLHLSDHSRQDSPIRKGANRVHPMVGGKQHAFPGTEPVWIQIKKLAYFYNFLIRRNPSGIQGNPLSISAGQIPKGGENAALVCRLPLRRSQRCQDFRSQIQPFFRFFRI